MAAVAFKLCFIILSCAVFVQADVAHLGYRQYSGQRAQSLRLQRLESRPTPYPAAGYRPNREFNLPREQPLFPLASEHSKRPQTSSGFDSLSRPQRPQLTYGSPDQGSRFPQQGRPQNFNGFNSLDGTQQNVFVEQTQYVDNDDGQPQHSFNEPQNGGFNNFGESQQPQFVNSVGNQQAHEPQNSDFNGGFSNVDETQQTQQRPDVFYGTPSIEEQESESQNGFDTISQPQYNYNAPSARLRQQLIARLQQAQRLEQSQAQSQRQQFFNAPQNVYSAPSFPLQQRTQRTQSQAESQSSRLNAARKPARLTDKREETEEEESDVKTLETVEDIETTTAKADGKKTVTQTAAATPVVANTGLVNYYPATAFSFVQPVNGAYVTSASYPTVQPVSAAYTVGSSFLPQQYHLTAAAPAPLQAW